VENRRIRELRQRLSLSQERFAQLLGVSLQSVRRWESGLARPLPIISLKLEELQRETSAPRRRGGGVPVRRTGDKGEVSAELGLGGLLKGIGNLVDLVSKMAEEGREETAGSGEIEAMGGRLKGVYGFSVRLGLGGRPIIEQFGNIQETATGPTVAETREPLVDVLDEGDHLAVIAELPGVDEKDIRVTVEGDIVEIVATTGDRSYQKEVLLPAAAAASLESSYRNGVLEIRLAKQ
jgi:HSP20 family protein